jgi:hypothetical protein
VSAPTVTARTYAEGTALAFTVVASSGPHITPHGAWLDPFVFRHVSDRPYRIVNLRRLRFRTASGRILTVEPGEISDGASFPELVGRVVGSRERPEFRRATMLHDDECRRRVRPSAEVHATLELALLSDGAAPWRASVLGRGVRWFGPRW